MSHDEVGETTNLRYERLVHHLPLFLLIKEKGLLIVTLLPPLTLIVTLLPPLTLIVTLLPPLTLIVTLLPPLTLIVALLPPLTLIVTLLPPLTLIVTLLPPLTLIVTLLPPLTLTVPALVSSDEDTEYDVNPPHEASDEEPFLFNEEKQWEMVDEAFIPQVSGFPYLIMAHQSA